LQLLFFKCPACLLADVNECAVETACGPNTICSNGAGNYTCACKGGFQLLEGQNATVHGCAGEQSVGFLCAVADLAILTRLFS
jgi:hypothetical protein